MSMAHTESFSADQLKPEQVADYLRDHPEFLETRPELLSMLKLSHDTPAGVSSLIEKQVAILRAENQRYRDRLNDLQQSQEETRALTDLVHQLALRILGSEQAEDACDILHDFLHNDYAADASKLFLFLDDDLVIATPMLNIRGRHDKLRLLLAELFNRKQPLLDSLQSEYLSLIFDDQGEHTHSSILVPLIGHDWEGLLVVGSGQRDRYRRGPELELLAFLARITALRLDQWLTAETP